MKAKHLILVGLLIGMGGTTLAQEKKSKVCIKMDKDENGTITKVDTCFESSDHSEIEAFLKQFGEGHTEIKIEEGGPRKRVIVKTRGVHKGSKPGDENTFEENDSIEKSVVVFIDEKGNVITEDVSGGHVIVKKVDCADSEMEMENLNWEIENSQGGTQGKKKVMVFITKTITIDEVKGNTKKLPSTIQSNGEKFENLVVSPVPAKETIQIQFKGNSEEELFIRLIDEQGKIIFTEKSRTLDPLININLDVKAIQPGLYFLQLTQGNKSEIKKVMIAD